jgi:site-specific DNA recombinase
VTDRCVIYLRISGLNQSDYSIPTQLSACQAYAAERGYTIVAVFDDGESGAEYRDRKQLSALRAMVRAGDVDVVLAYDTDRYSRDTAHIFVLFDEIDYHGARLEFVLYEFEKTAIGKFILAAKTFAAEVEREKIIERSMRGRRARVAAGKLLAGPRPLYGYSWADDTKGALVINPDTAPIVRRIFREYVADGRSLMAIAQGLTEDGIPTPSGKTRWHTGVIGQILSKPYYTGRAYGWAWRGNQGRKMKSFDADGAIALPEGTIPRLIDDATWQAAQDAKAQRQLMAVRNNRYPEAALFRGMCFCAHCGYRMHIRHHSQRRPSAPIVYECSSTYNHGTTCAYHCVPAGDLDTAVWQAIIDHVVTPQRLRSAASAGSVRRSTLADELRPLEQRIQDLERQQGNLTRAIATLDDPDLSAPLLNQLRTITGQLRVVAEERAQIVARREADDRTRQAARDQRRLVTEALRSSEQLSYQQRRTLLEGLDTRVEVYRPGSREPRWDPLIRWDDMG